MSSKDIVNYFSFNTEIEDTKSYQERIAEAKIDLNEEYVPVTPCLSIGGTHFASFGNFSLISGKAKSRKTFLITLIASRLFRDSPDVDLIETNFPSNKRKVVFIDTEQSSYDVQAIGHRMQEITGKKLSGRIDFYKLRPESYLDRQIMISMIVRSTPDIGLLIIDGIKDLVTSVNDEYEATSISRGLMKISEEHDIHVMTVLHQNKTNSSLRGHLGTEVQNKAETVLEVKTADGSNVTKVRSVVSRKLPTPPFSFRINDDGLPEIIRSMDPPVDDGSQVNFREPYDISDDDHLQILKEVKATSSDNELKYSELLTSIKKVVSDKYDRIGDNVVRVYKDFYLDKGFITHHGTKRSQNSYYEITLPDSSDK